MLCQASFSGLSCIWSLPTWIQLVQNFVQQVWKWMPCQMRGWTKQNAYETSISWDTSLTGQDQQNWGTLLLLLWLKGTDEEHHVCPGYDCTQGSPTESDARFWLRYCKNDTSNIMYPPFWAVLLADRDTCETGVKLFIQETSDCRKVVSTLILWLQSSVQDKTTASVLE